MIGERFCGLGFIFSLGFVLCVWLSLSSRSIFVGRVGDYELLECLCVGHFLIRHDLGKSIRSVLSFCLRRFFFFFFPENREQDLAGV